ncbi:hypothetical protein ABPG74_014866 [Tetrahymena malaccensis]
MQNIEYKIVNLSKIEWSIKDNIVNENNTEPLCGLDNEFIIKLSFQPEMIDKIRIGYLNIPKVKIQLYAVSLLANSVYEKEFDLISKNDFLKEDQNEFREKGIIIECEKKVSQAIFTFQNPYHKQKSDCLKFFYLLLEKKGPDSYDKKLFEKNRTTNNIQQQKFLNNFLPQQPQKKELQLNIEEKVFQINKKTLQVPEGGGGYNSIINNKNNSPTSNKKEPQKYYQYKNEKQKSNHVIQEQSFEKFYNNEKKQQSKLNDYKQFSSKEDEDYKKAIAESMKDVQNMKLKEEKKLIQQSKDDSCDSIDTQIIEDDIDNNSNTYKNQKDSSAELQKKNKVDNQFKQLDNKIMENDLDDPEILKAIELSKQEQEIKKKQEEQEIEEQIQKIKETSNSTQQMEEETKEMKQKAKGQMDEENQAQNLQNSQKSEKKQNYLMKLSENSKRVNIKIQNADPQNENDSFYSEENNSNKNKANNQQNHNNSKQNNQNNSKNVMEEEIVKEDIEKEQIEEKYKQYLNSGHEGSNNINGKQNKPTNIDSVKKNNQNIWNQNDKMEIENSDINHKSEANLESFKYKPNGERVYQQTKLFENNKLIKQDNIENRNGSNQQRFSININNKSYSNNNQQQSNNQVQLKSHYFQLETHNLSERILKFQRQQEQIRKISEKYYLFQSSIKDILRDKVITISGYEGQQRDDIKQLISDLGAKYQQELNELCHYMITKDKKTDKYNQYLRNKDLLKHLKIVDKKFLNMCKINKKLINYQDYLIQ